MSSATAQRRRYWYNNPIVTLLRPPLIFLTWGGRYKRRSGHAYPKGVPAFLFYTYPQHIGTVAKFGQVPGVGANCIRPIRRPPWGRMIARPGTCGANAILRRSKPHVGGLSVGVRRLKPRVGGLSVGVRRSKPHVGGLSVGVQRSKPRVGGLSVGVRRLEPRVGGLSVGVRRLKPHVGGISVDVQGSKTPRPDPYGDAPASFLFERQVRLEACTVGVGELLQQRQLAPTADGAVLAA